MAPVRDDFSLPKMLAYLYTEVNQSKPHNPNKPIDKTAHRIEEQIVQDAIKLRLVDEDVVFIWGPGGVGDETDGTPASARWGFTALWG